MTNTPWIGAVTAVCLHVAATAQAAWQQLPGFTSRRGAAVAYDAARAETVIFGGDDGRVLDETWVWNGTVLVQRTPLHRPPPRAEGTLVYDSVRQRLVLFGGSTVNDTWSWDGSDWQQIATATNPTTSSQIRTMVFDPVRDRIWLWAATPASSGQLWRFDGTDWAMVPGTPPWPSADDGMFAFDADTGTAALYDTGGAMWRWNGTQWTWQQGPALAQHFGGRMVHDPVGHRLLLAGGWSGASATTLYEWQSFTGQWTALASGGPTTQQHGAVFDPVRNTVVVVGGPGTGGTEVDSSIWEWSGGPWQRRTFAPPFARYRHAMAYDRTGDRVFLFGDTGSHGDLWVRENGDWRLLVPHQPASATHPGSLGLERRLAYDDARGELLLLGGSGPLSFWRLGAGGWQSATAAVLGTRRDPGVAYDRLRQRLVLFGGGPFPYRNDTWAWDGTAWTQLITATSPPGRAAAGMAYDARRDRIVLLGGLYSAGLAGDTWEFDGADWQLRASGPQPQAAASTVTWDEARQVVVAFAGGGSSAPMATWQWDGAMWTQLLNGPAPASRGAAAIVGTDADVLAFGGNLYNGGATAQQLSLRTPWPAAVAPFGAPGSSAAGPLLLTAGPSRPWLGATFVASIEPLPAIALPGLYAGGSRASWLGVPLPLDLAPFGWSGQLSIAPEIPVPVLQGGTTASVAIALPSSPVLAGAELHLQAFVFEPLSGVIAASNGLALTAGLR
jgi:hypothetical protein